MNALPYLWLDRVNEGVESLQSALDKFPLRVLTLNPADVQISKNENSLSCDEGAGEGRGEGWLFAENNGLNNSPNLLLSPSLSSTSWKRGGSDSHHYAISPGAAFTLIELIMAVAISAIVMGAIGTLLFGALHLRDTATAAAAQTTPVDHAVSVMKGDLVAIKPPGILPGSMGSDATGVGMTIPPLLEIFSANGVISDDQPWGDVQKIDYWLQAPSNKTSVPGRDLMRGVTRNLLSTAPVPPVAQTLLQGVQNLQFSYYDGTNWNDTWSTTLSNIPIAVRVTIDFATGQNSKQIEPEVQFLAPIVAWSNTNSITNQVSN